MMFLYYLYFPVGSNQDGLEYSGLAHLVEHYLILAFKEKYRKDNIGALDGQTSHEHVLLSWREYSYSLENKTAQNIMSLIEDIRNNDILIDENLLLRAKEEVARELSIREESIDRYNQLLSFIGEGLVSPIGELNSIDNITKADIYEMLNQFKFAKIYIYDWSSDSLQRLNINQIVHIDESKKNRLESQNFVNVEYVKLNIDNYRMKILVPAKRTNPSDDRDMFKNGAIRDFFI